MNNLANINFQEIPIGLWNKCTIAKVYEAEGGRHVHINRKYILKIDIWLFLGVDQMVGWFKALILFDNY